MSDSLKFKIDALLVELGVPRARIGWHGNVVHFLGHGGVPQQVKLRAGSAGNVMYADEVLANIRYRVTGVSADATVE